MKKTILIIMMFILSLPLVYSIYGGETWSYHFDKCDELKVNITGKDRIDDGEYTILNNCTKNETNYYICDCNDNYDFSVTFKINAINNYTFSFNYAYSKAIEEQQSSGGGGSSSGSSGAFTVRFQENKTRRLMLKPNIISRFWINGNQHTIKLTDIFNDSVRLEIRSEPQIIDLALNQSRIITIDNEELELTLTEIRGRIAFIEFKKLPSYVEIDEPIIEEEPIQEETEETPEEEPIEDLDVSFEEEEQTEETPKFMGLMILFAVVILGLIIYAIYRKLKENEE